MITVRSQTPKKELLKNLQKHSEETSTLYIHLESLPSFLHTPVAFTIFNYQINSYPRPITWIAGNKAIFDVLGTVKTSIISKEEFEKTTGQSLQKAVEVDEPAPFAGYAQRPIGEVDRTIEPKLKSIKIPGIAEGTKGMDVIKKTDSKTIIDNEGNSRLIDRSKPLIIKQSSNSAAYVEKNELKTHDTKQTESANKTTIDEESKTSHSELESILSSEGVFVQNGNIQEDRGFKDRFSKKQTFHSTPLIDTSSEIEDRFHIHEDSDAPKQNLDVWLKRLSDTKSALDSLKKDSVDPYHALTIQYNEQHQIAKPVQKKQLNNIFFIAGSISMAVLAVAFIILFPTVAYTVTVKPEVLEENIELELVASDFAKRSVKLDTVSSTPSSGQQEVPTERAIGQVSLINPGNKDVTLDNGQFRLIANNREYEAVLNTTLSRTFRIPARNNLNGPAIEFTVQAREPGPDYNLPNGSQLEIVNLLGQKVCLNCYGITITNIQNSTISGETTVTDADHSLLLGSIESDLAKNRVEEIENIQEENIFTNPNWYKNTGSSYEFSDPVGTLTPEVSLTVDVNTDIYYLPQDLLENKIKEQNSEVEKINQIALVETSGSFSEDESIKLVVYYAYDKVSDLDTRDVRNTISDTDCQEAPTKLHQQYPTIDYVDCRNLGVQVPGLSPRVDVTIVSN